MPETDSPKKTIRVPFTFGQIVYHRARKEKIAGAVIGFIVTEHCTKTLVRWGVERLDQDECFFCELTTEYQPDFSSSES